MTRSEIKDGSDEACRWDGYGHNADVSKIDWFFPSYADGGYMRADFRIGVPPEGQGYVEFAELWLEVDPTWLGSQNPAIKGILFKYASYMENAKIFLVLSSNNSAVSWHEHKVKLDNTMGEWISQPIAFSTFVQHGLSEVEVPLVPSEITRIRFKFEGPWEGTGTGFLSVDDIYFVPETAVSIDLSRDTFHEREITRTPAQFMLDPGRVFDLRGRIVGGLGTRGKGVYVLKMDRGFGSTAAAKITDSGNIRR